MVELIHSLGLVPVGVNLSWWLLRQLAHTALPRAQQWLAGPPGPVSRVGDVLVWQGQNGQRVLAGLEGLGESNARIEQAVGRVEQAQIAAGQALGALTALSMATLGFGALAAGFMLCRLNALQSRLESVAAQLTDIQAHLTARDQAHIGTALRSLQYHENGSPAGDLQEARRQSTFAVELYRKLVQGEARGQRRLLALHEYGRHYLLALSVQVRCLVLCGALGDAAGSIECEEGAMAELAQAMFDLVLGQSPAIYLDPNLKGDGVTLELLADVYQQASQAGVKTGVDEAGPARLFEHIRGSVGTARITGSWWPWTSFEAEKAGRLSGLKYLMGCVEDVNRVRGFRLRIVDAQEHGYSMQELEQQIRPLREEATAAAPDKEGSPVMAYAFA